MKERERGGAGKKVHLKSGSTADPRKPVAIQWQVEAKAKAASTLPPILPGLHYIADNAATDIHKIYIPNMLASGFTNAPVTRFLVIGTVLSAFAASITDTKYYFWIQPRPHLFDYWQFWRFLTWQACYTNTTEVLFAAMTFYQLRVIERLWGSRKFASFIISTFPYTTLLPPILLAAVIRPLSFGNINYLPAGPTPIVFALLAQYHAAIPYIYKYRVSSSNPVGTSSNQEYGLMLTSKSTSYLLPLQLALSQLPGSAIAAGVGWIVGFAYRREILPGAARWRVPSWIIGGSEEKARYDNLRRRMEGEAGRATGVENTNREQHVRRRGVVGGLIDQFRGAF